MAISGRFDADFADFFAACRQATVELRGFEAGSSRVEGQLNRMVDSFTGREVITQANLMAEAVGRIGGPSRLSASELARVGATASEAADKFRRWGQEVPPNIARLEAAAKSASGGMTGMARAIADTDNVLGLFGVNLVPARKALDDLEFSGGKTIKQLGLIGTATIAAGSAMAGIQFGRWVAGWTDSDKIIGDATAKLLGWGDVAGVTAAAKADMLAKASKEVGFQVTQVSTAMAVNQAAAIATTAANKRLSDQFIAEAAAAKKAGEEIERVHQNNADKFFKLTQEWVAAMHVREQAEIDAAAKANQAMLDEIDTATKLNEAHHAEQVSAIEAQEMTKKKTEEATKALQEQKDAADAVARSLGNTIEYDLSTPEGFARFQKLNPSATISVGSDYFKDHTLQDAINAGLINLYAGYATSVANRSGYTGGGAAGATLVGASTVNVQVSGVMDPRTIDALSTAVSAAIVKGTGSKVGIH